MRNRLILALVGVAALILVVHDIPLARHLERVERDRLITGYERDGFILGGQAEDGLDHNNATELPQLTTMVEDYATERGVEVVITDRNGVAVVTSDDSKLGSQMDNRPEIADALRTAAPQLGERFSTTLDQQLVFIAVPVLSGPEVVGVVRISAPSATISDRVNSQIRGLVLVAAISLLIASFVAWLVASGFIRPLTSLRHVTDRFAAGDLSVRADRKEGPPEVGALALSFNTMASQIEQLVDRQRDFAGVASHQLRTPLTALRLRLEALQEQVDPDGPLADGLDEATDEADRLSRMIEGLLMLSRTDGATMGTATENLADIVRERAEFWEPLAAERKVAIEVTAPTHINAVVVRGGLSQIIDNLVDNALEVAPPESQISIDVAETDGLVSLSISDAGPGLTEEQREQAFERFWRAESAPEGGTGLGLSIVRQLVVASGGSAALEPRPGGGTIAQVLLQRPSS